MPPVEPPPPEQPDELNTPQAPMALQADPLLPEPVPQR